MEEWRPIKGYEGIYEVSSLGRVRSLDRVILSCNKGTKCKLFYKGRILKSTCRLGYPTVNLADRNHVVHRVSIHVLVAHAFIPGYKKGLYVNHVDENRANNIVSNLEWVTPRQNKLWSIKNCYNKGISKPAFQYDLQGNLIKSYPSAGEASRATGIPAMKICDARRGVSHIAGGYIWKYE